MTGAEIRIIKMICNLPFYSSANLRKKHTQTADNKNPTDGLKTGDDVQEEWRKCALFQMLRAQR